MDTISRKDIINNFMMVCFIMETLICQIINSVVTIPMISVVLMFVILIITTVVNGKTHTSLSSRHTLVFSFLFILLLLSSIINDSDIVLYYGANFCAFGITALFLLRYVKVNLKLVLQDGIIIGLFYFAVYFLVLRNSLINSDEFWSQQMGQAYGAILPTIFALVLLVWRKKLKISFLYLILSLITIVVGSFIIFLDCGTRGAMASLLISVIMLLIGKSSDRKIIFYLLLAVVLVYFLLANIEDFLYSIESISSMLGIEIPALTKTLHLLQYNNMSNGRESTYGLAYKIFEDNPIIGHGVGYYEIFSKGSYVHNIFLDLLCQVGVVGTLIFIYLMITNFISVFFKRVIYTEQIFSELLFLSSIPLLCFSSTFWMLPVFWIYFWNLLNKKSNQTYIDNL